MIDQHLRLDPTKLSPHCLICWMKLTKEDTVISYKGYRTDTGDFGYTLWMCADCSIQLSAYLMNDRRKLITRRENKNDDKDIHRHGN